MQVVETVCPKCSAKVAVPLADAAMSGRLRTVECPACRYEFDARAALASASVQDTLAPGPNAPAAPPPRKALEPMAPAAAAAELQKQGLRLDVNKPARRVPKKIGAYDVLSEISRGGMGVVYKAVDTQLRRMVAIKVLLSGEGAKDEDLKRFKREAQATARLQHPNIVQIYAVGDHEGEPYLVMDFVEGKTAKRLREEGQMTPHLALSILESVAEALHHAHLHGVIHRDVKPANIIVDKNERVQLMDFGLARRVDEDLEVTQSGTTMGTPSYMSPEQAEGHLDEVDAQSDVYSAGSCLYDLLTGRPPFEAPTILATLRRVLEESPVPPRRLNPKIHQDVETICLKCLEKNKKNRYATAKQLADDIRRFNAGEAISAKPLGFFAWCWRKLWRHKEISLALCAIVCSALAALVYSFNQSRRAARQQIEDRQKKLREELADAQQKLSVGKESLARLSDAAPEQFSQHRDVVRGQLAEAQKAFGQVEAGNAEAESALKTLRKLENELEVRHFLHKARMFLSPPKVRPGEAQELPNYAGAEFAAQEAADRDPGNTEAKELLILAKGTRAVAIETEGSPAEVFAKRIVDVTGRQLSSVPGLGLPLGRTPVKGSKLEPGLYLISFKCAGLVGRVGNPPYEVQQATLLVTRDAKDEDLRLRITVNAPEENMVLIPAGNVTLPQHGSVAVPPFAIDRFEYPNKAGTVPATGLSLVDVQALCKKQGKALCNPGQWLRACMGDGERRYPYGAAYLSRACATGFDFEAQKQPLPSGLFARCRTPEGVYDMSGNVAEWTDTTEQENTFGGDWTSSTRVADLTVSCWARSPHDEVGPDRLGFRCCKGK